ncbi:adenylosuccinate lyase [Candidatus Woesearchaeota archaeon]|nr:adenylosuccinate lyase [Candidatus Woesearchaeota archaeon]
MAGKMTNYFLESLLSPLDTRYTKIVRPLRKYFSDDVFYAFRVQVELEYFSFFLEQVKGISLSRDEKTLLEKISTPSKDKIDLIKIIENEGCDGRPKTNHDIKAIEYFIKNLLKETSLEEFTELVHFGLTSEDINNITYGIMLSKAVTQEITPSLQFIYSTLVDLALKYKDIPMLARTHNQPASPTTLGKELAVFALRLERQINNLTNQRISAKLNGATGNYNALHLAYPEIDWIDFSRRFIRYISNKTSTNLEFTLLTTQIIPADNYAELFNTVKLTSLILQGLCQDIWEYIGREYFILKQDKGQIGSSTMPHKVNPIDFENAEGNYKKVKHFCNMVVEELLISRQQRDLSDSTIKREFGEVLARFYLANKILSRGLSKIEANPVVLTEDLEKHPEVISEGIQTILRREGNKEGYEKLMILTQGKKTTLEELRIFIGQLTISKTVKEKLLQLTPTNYTGIASKLAEKI